MSLHPEQWESLDGQDFQMSQTIVDHVVSLLRDAIDKQDFDLVEQSMLILEEPDNYFSDEYNIQFE
jgi:hypothetical protein